MQKTGRDLVIPSSLLVKSKQGITQIVAGEPEGDMPRKRQALKMLDDRSVSPDKREMKSLQDTYAPNGRCFGCGPKNEKGLKIQSFVKDQEVVAEFLPQPHHEAFENVLNGGIIGSVLDCHCNWAAAHFLMQYHLQQTAPCTVTAQYTIKLLKPTPSHEKLQLVAKLDKIDHDRAWITGELRSGDKVCATCHGLFVAVKPDHPAYHRW